MAEVVLILGIEVGVSRSAKDAILLEDSHTSASGSRIGTINIPNSNRVARAMLALSIILNAWVYRK